ncbi:N-myc-interactor [Crotalus tigris]|uniref:N-myc-interactor n=1 Tax=Crotalus tigris TaxID=88082 RepID=UPI00192F8E8F|nr:N-myc-interactor [Crotalus tigris]XP_039183770.1 N-myc-interactor [Crotalus tigris]
MSEGEISKTSTSETELLEELEKWKEKLEKIEKRKTEILLSKLALDEKRKMKQKALADLKDQSNKQVTERMRIEKKQQEQLSLICEQNSKLRKEIEVLKVNLAAKKMKCGELIRSYSLQQCLLKKKMKFVHLEDAKDEDDYTNFSCRFHLATKIPFTVNQGEALIQFEEESVAQQLIRKHNHIINLENKEIALKAYPVPLETGTTFKIHVKILQREICVSNIPNVKIAEEWMKDKLELLFCKAKLGEIQNIFYDPLSQKAIVTFSQPLALNKIIRYEQSCISVFGKIHLLTVSPVIKSVVEKVQMFSGTSRKTVLLTGIDAEQKDEENVGDMIEIHFQKPSNGGGEVDRVTYIPKGTKTVYFELDEADFIGDS